MGGKRPCRVAEIGAFQEAGVKGVIAKKSIGAYPYPKILPGGEDRLCFVDVYPLPGIDFALLDMSLLDDRVYPVAAALVL